MGWPTKPSLAQGSVLVGNASGKAAALDASGDTKVLVGNATTVTSVALSGDVTMANTGAVTIAASAVESSMIAANSITTGKLYKDLVRVAHATFDSTAVKALNATPGVCVDHSALVASGDIATGDVLVFEGALLQIYGGSTNYDQNENLTFNYQTAGGGATVSLTIANFFNAGAADKMSTCKPLATDVTPEADQDIVVKCSASPYNAAGDRSCKVTVWYRVFTPAS